jgi:hypothetical protein
VPVQSAELEALPPPPRFTLPRAALPCPRPVSAQRFFSPLLSSTAPLPCGLSRLPRPLHPGLAPRLRSASPPGQPSPLSDEPPLQSGQEGFADGSGAAGATSVWLVLQAASASSMTGTDFCAEGIGGKGRGMSGARAVVGPLVRP